MPLVDEQGDALFQLTELAEFGGERERVRVVLRESVAEHIVNHFLPDYVGFALFQDAKRGIKAGLGGVRAEHGSAEGVNRADTGGVDFAEQALPGGSLRVGNGRIV
jgi:hypothetical protein